MWPSISPLYALIEYMCYVERKKWENRKKSGKLHHHAAISNLTGQSFTRVMSSLSHSFNRRHLSSLPSSAAVASCRRRAGLCSFSILQVGFFFITKFHHTTSSACVGFCIVNNNRSQRKKNRLSYVKIVHKTWCKLAPSRVQWSFFCCLFVHIRFIHSGSFPRCPHVLLSSFGWNKKKTTTSDRSTMTSIFYRLWHREWQQAAQSCIIARCVKIT